MEAGAAPRTNLLIGAGQRWDPGLLTAADMVTVDQSLMPRVAGRSRRGAAAEAAPGRTIHMRIPIDRRLGFETSLEGDVNASVSAVLLGGVDRPQDVRDADVALRRREMRLGLEPGCVRLISEVASAVALRALPQMIEAVDRHSALALNTDGLAADLRLPGGPQSHLALLEYAMAEVSVTARVARLPWLLLAPALNAGARSMLATRAHAHGAAGVYIAAEPEAAGFNSLFTR